MKIAEIQSLFLNTVGAHLKQKGFKHTKTKGMYRIVKNNYSYTIWTFFFKYSSGIRLDLIAAIGCQPCEKIIKKRSRYHRREYLIRRLKKISTFLSLPFDNNNKWDFIYNEKDANIKFRQCITYLDTIVEPFWQQYSNIELLYKYIKPTISNRTILLPPTLENILNITTIAFLLKEDETAFKTLITEAHQHLLSIKNEHFCLLFTKLINYIEKEKTN